MNEIELIEINYKVKNHYVFEDMSLFSPKDIKLIYDNPEKFEEYYCEIKRNGESYKPLRKIDFDNIINGKFMGMTKSMEVDILSRMKGIVKTHIKNSANLYILPRPKYETEFYVFNYDQLKFVFYVFLMDMEEKELELYKRKSSGASKIIGLNRKMYQNEFEIFYFPVNEFDSLKHKFINEYIPYIKTNKEYREYFVKRLGGLLGVKK